MGDAESSEPIPDLPPFDPTEEERKPKLVARDPVCGIDVDPDGAPARTRYRGTAYYFCTTVCKQAFELDPRRYVG